MLRPAEATHGKSNAVTHEAACEPLRTQTGICRCYRGRHSLMDGEPMVGVPQQPLQCAYEHVNHQFHAAD